MLKSFDPAHADNLEFFGQLADATTEYINSVERSFFKRSYLLKQALHYLEWECTDEGPPGEGWKSEKLESLIRRIKKELGREEE